MASQSVSEEVREWEEAAKAHVDEAAHQFRLYREHRASEPDRGSRHWANYIVELKALKKLRNTMPPEATFPETPEP